MRNVNRSLREYIEQAEVDGQKLRKVKASELSLSPYHRSIGSLVSFTSKGQRIKGTAFMISKDLIVTAAHNIYNKDSKADNTNFKFYLAANGVISTYFQIQFWRYPSEYRTADEDKKTDYDYAILKLKSQQKGNLNNCCQLFLSCKECERLNGLQIQELQLDIYGYPFHQSLPNYTPHNRQQDKLEIYQYGLTRSRKVYLNAKTNVLKYKISTYPGQSGSPIHVSGTIIGIHLGRAPNGEKSNIGTLLTLNMLQRLTIWSSALEGQPFKINQKSICSHYSNKQEFCLQRFKQIGVQTMLSSRQSQVNSKLNLGNLNKIIKADVISKRIFNLNKSVNVDNNPEDNIPQLTQEQKSINKSLILFTKGEEHLQRQQLSQSLCRLFESLQIQSKLKGKNKLYLARTLSQIGNVYRFQGNLSKVIDYFQQSAEIYEQLKVYNSEYWRIMNILGCAYYNKYQDYASSALIFQKCLMAAELIQDQQRIKYSKKWLFDSQNNLSQRNGKMNASNSSYD